MGNQATEAGLSRRKAIGRVAAAGAAAWVAPTLISSPARAAGTLGSNVCADIGRPNFLTYQYVGGWVWSICVDPKTGPMADTRVPVPYTWPGWVPLRVVMIKPAGGALTQVFTVPLNGTFVVGPMNTGNPNLQFYFGPADNGNLDPAPNGTPRANLSNWTPRMVVHVSCSQALCVGDQHGPLLVTAYS